MCSTVTRPQSVVSLSLSPCGVFRAWVNVFQFLWLLFVSPCFSHQGKAAWESPLSWTPCLNPKWAASRCSQTQRRGFPRPSKSSPSVMVGKLSCWVTNSWICWLMIQMLWLVHAQKTCWKIASLFPDIEEKGVRMKLTVIDTPGFGDQINNENWWVTWLLKKISPWFV